MRFLAKPVRYVLQNVTFAEHEASRTCVMLTRDFSASKKDVEPYDSRSVKVLCIRVSRLRDLPAITAKMDNTA